MEKTGAFACLFLLATSLLLCDSAFEPNPYPNWFPFYLDGLDSSTTPTDLSYLNPRPAGEDGFIKVEDGHFVDGNGARTRFFGTNILADACFPDILLAPRIAKHLRKLGINAVRFGIFLDSSSSGVLDACGAPDPVKANKFDFFVSQLKECGIYSDLMIHAGSFYGMTNDYGAQFQSGKMIDRFYRRFIHTQKFCMEAFLDHVNPYTGNAYAHEPAVLCIELNNEDTIFPFFENRIEEIPEPYAACLKELWNKWLRKNYHSDSQLEAAWRSEMEGSGMEKLKDPYADKDHNRYLDNWLYNWYVDDYDEGATHLLKADADRKTLTWSVNKAMLNPACLGIMQMDLPLKEGKYYTLSFYAKAIGDRSQPDLDLGISAQLYNKDWDNVGLWKTVKLSLREQFFSIAFRVSNTDPNAGCLNFSILTPLINGRTWTVEFSKMHLNEGAKFDGLPEGESLAAVNISIPAKTDSPAGSEDFLRFLGETERATLQELNDLVAELGVESLVLHGQVNYGGFFGLLRESSRSDFIDMHGYWDHLFFKNPPNTVFGTCKNTSQIEDWQCGTLAGLALNRVADLPFGVSEYNIPVPNYYTAETLPMLSAFAAFQDWDAVFTFCYLDFPEHHPGQGNAAEVEWNPDHILGDWDFASHPGKMVFHPAAALVFRKGLVAESVSPLTLSVPRSLEEPPTDMKSAIRMWGIAGIEPKIAAIRGMKVKIHGGGGDVKVSETIQPERDLLSDTGQISWHISTPERPENEPNRSLFRVTADSVRIAAGHIAGRAIELGNVVIEVGKMEMDYACVELVALDGNPIDESNGILLATAAGVKNAGMRMAEDENGVYVADWGTGQSIAEKVPFRIKLPGRGWRAYMLDKIGAPTGDSIATYEEMPVSTIITVENPKTLWYLLTR